MSFSETIFLFFLALIIFGPKKLPEIARQAGKWLNEFKRASNEFRSQIEQEIAHLEVDNKQTILPPSEPPDHATSRTQYAAAELETHAEAPALAASSEGEVSSSQASPVAPTASEDVTASDPVGAAAAPDARFPESHV
jgi:sec-independent protein translocase protein TatB